MYILYCLFKFATSTIVAQVPTKPQIPPTMEILDDEHVVVDYSKSFSIPDFSKILTVISVLDMGGVYRGSATKD